MTQDNPWKGFCNRGMDADDIEVGGLYDPDDLPENNMNNSGKLEWVADDTLALALGDGLFFEFEMAVKCTGIGRVEERGTIETLEGELK